jgi:hypothetical protein
VRGAADSPANFFIVNKRGYHGPNVNKQMAEFFCASPRGDANFMSGRIGVLSFARESLSERSSG